ncbi:MAG: SurA N-terminal domain-containing protein [Endomicrobium sp.]|jgi:parvulin-like peptidyl-prolyl isomerase|nr:SurA N-terminal domain-containing protein [Endomicrobium sp.]
MAKKFLAMLAVVMMFAVCGALAAESDVDKTIAVVNNEPIMASEFNKVLIPMLEQYRQSVPAAEQSEARVNEFKTALLNQKIEDILLKQEAKKKKIKISKKELGDGIAQIKKRFANEAEFNAELKKEGISMTEFEKRLDEQMSVMRLVEQTMKSKAKVPDEAQVKSFFDSVQVKMKGGETGLSKEDDEIVANVANFLKRMSAEQVRLRQVFIDSPKASTAEEKKAALARVEIVKKAVKSGDSFVDIASKYSEDAASRARGGDIGIVVKGDLPVEIDKVIFNMNVGEYTKEPIKTDNGFHFLRVEEKRASKTFTFDEVKNDIGELLYQNEAKKAYAAWMQELKSKANIKDNSSWK